jgi:ATP-dependent DNA helicase RecG
MNENGYKTLSAFSNTEGGLLLLGISDDGDIVGCDCSDEPVRTIANKIMSKMGIHPTINILESDGYIILIIEVGKCDIPISYNGNYYKRVGTTTTGILGDELKEFFLLGSNWDGLSNDYSLQEIDGDFSQEIC